MALAVLQDDKEPEGEGSDVELPPRTPPPPLLALPRALPLGETVAVSPPGGVGLASADPVAPPKGLPVPFCKDTEAVSDTVAPPVPVLLGVAQWVVLCAGELLADEQGLRDPEALTVGVAGAVERAVPVCVALPTVGCPLPVGAAREGLLVADALAVRAAESEPNPLLALAVAQLVTEVAPLELSTCALVPLGLAVSPPPPPGLPLGVAQVVAVALCATPLLVAPTDAVANALSEGVEVAVAPPVALGAPEPQALLELLREGQGEYV